MTEAEIRGVVAAALTDAGAHGDWNGELAHRFVAGECDVHLDQLELDSLATMELCIGIEVHCGVEIVPDQLRRVTGLRQLAALVGKRA